MSRSVRRLRNRPSITSSGANTFRQPRQPTRHRISSTVPAAVCSLPGRVRFPFRAKSSRAAHLGHANGAFRPRTGTHRRDGWHGTDATLQVITSADHRRTHVHRRDHGLPAWPAAAGGNQWGTQATTVPHLQETPTLAVQELSPERVQAVLPPPRPAAAPTCPTAGPTHRGSRDRRPVRRHDRAGFAVRGRGLARRPVLRGSADRRASAGGPTAREPLLPGRDVEDDHRFDQFAPPTAQGSGGDVSALPDLLHP
jgi:hypothetical protein